MKVPSAVFDDDGPVDERTARALAIDSVVRDHVTEFLAEEARLLKIALGAALAGLLLGGGLLAAGSGAVGVGVLLLGVASGGGVYYYSTTLEPDFTVTGIEKGHWTGYYIPESAGSVVYDATNTLADSEFNLEQLQNPDSVRNARERLDELQEFPVVMDRDENPEADLVRTLEDVHDELSRAERTTVSAPVVGEDEPLQRSLERVVPYAEPETVDTGWREVPVDDAESDVKKLSDLESMADQDTGEADLQELSQESRELATELSGLQETAVELLNDHIESAGDAFAMLSYNYYCPNCAVDDIESTVELVGQDNDSWYCPTCRNRFDEELMIPRHQIRDDVVTDVWDLLWTEKDDQRREIYENIEDQKAELTEREFEQRREEIRNVSDRIKDLRSRIRDLKTKAKAGEGTVEEIGRLMVKYDRLNEERKQEFTSEVQDTYEEIDRETERIIEETRNIEEERIQEAQEEAEQRARLMRAEERQREREMVAYQEAMANQRTAAELQAQGKAIETMEEQHEEDMLLKTRGSIHPLDTVNAARSKWDGLTGRTARNGGD